MTTSKRKQYQQISDILADTWKDQDVLDALESFITVYKERRTNNHTPQIPLALFSDRKLGILEVTVKYLRERSSLKFCAIAPLINRDPRTVWVAYTNAKKKHKDLFTSKDDSALIPANIFSDRTLGPLEALTVYLKDQLNLSFNDIAKHLNRNYRTIWRSYDNAIRKKNHAQ